MIVWYKDYLVKGKELFERKIAVGRKTVDDLAQALKAFKEDHGRYPESLDVLVARPAEMNRSWASTAGKWTYFKGDRTRLDPSRQKYRYLVPGRINPDSFDVWSVHGNSHDPWQWISNWLIPEANKKCRGAG